MLDRPYFRVDVFHLDEYNIHDVKKKIKKVEAHLLEQPEVKRVSVTFGNTPLCYYLAPISVGPKLNFANLLVKMTDSKYAKEYEGHLDSYMKKSHPNTITRTTLFKLSPTVDAAIEIGFIGNSTDTLVMLTNKVLGIVHHDNDPINVRNSWGNRVPMWKLIYN